MPPTSILVFYIAIKVDLLNHSEADYGTSVGRWVSTDIDIA
jgi:hypothetical protein